MARIGRTLSFSNVISLVALFVALGGSVYAAGKLSGSQIRPNSIPGNRIKPKSLTGKQVHSKSLTGKQIKPDSLSGNQINEASLSDVVSRLDSVQYVSVNLPLSPSATTGAAFCPPGTYAISGGASVSDDNNAFVNDSGPGSVPHNGWTATGYGESGTSMRVTAVCVYADSVGSTP